MVLTVNTNTGAMLALQSLNKTTKLLALTQQRVTSGLRINGPKDDGGTYAIAQQMRGDIASMGAVKTALSSGRAAIDVAIQAGTSIADLLVEMKAKAVQGSQAGLEAATYTALNTEFAELRNQVDSLVANASFNGTNLVSSNPNSLNIMSTIDGSSITAAASSLDATTLVIHTAALTAAAASSTAAVQIDTAIGLVASALAVLGATAKRVEIQQEFTAGLQDILKEAVGGLVDADLAKESANLQALQIKQALGVQALAIANAGPQSLLALFQ